MGDVENVATGQTGGAGSKQPQAEEDAAQMIQRNYRGYRERRQLKGIGLDASARWAEVCRAAVYCREESVLIWHRQ
jgi:hypothetical protein